MVFRNLSAQLSRRSIDVHFSRYQATNEADVRAFKSVLWSFQPIFPWSKNLTCCNTGSIAMSGPSAVWVCSKIGSYEPLQKPLSRARSPFLAHYSNNMPSRWIVAVRWSPKRSLVKRHSPKMTMLPIDCVFAWGWNRGRQNCMGKICKAWGDRKGAFHHNAVAHTLDNGNRYATRSKRKVALESKMWREPL